MPDGGIIPFGSPGGDVQPQAMLPVLLNVVVFGMTLQEAVEMPIEDMYTHGARIREDGMVIRPVYVFEGKRPSQSSDSWDLLRWTDTVDKNTAFPRPSDGKCNLVRS